MSDSGSLFEFDSTCAEDTARLGRALAEVVELGDLLTLTGELGAGKTTLVRALCEGLGVPEEAGVSSPSYALVQLYEGGRWPVAHMDLYRVEGGDELEALGFRDLLAGDAVVVVEWPERADGTIELADFHLQLDDLGPERRLISVRAPDDETLAALQQALRPR